MGSLFGRDREVPWDLFIPRITRYRRSKSRNCTESPRTIEKCLMAAMCTLTFACELNDAVWVAYQIRTVSVGGNGLRCKCEQNLSYADTAEL